MRELVLNHAIGYWLQNAQKKLESKQPKAAMEFLKSALEVAPESVSARFLMARCHAESKEFGDAYLLLEDTKKILPWRKRDPRDGYKICRKHENGSYQYRAGRG